MLPIGQTDLRLGPLTRRLKLIYCKFGNFREGFIFAKLREMPKSLSRLLIYVNHGLVADF